MKRSIIVLLMLTVTVSILFTQSSLQKVVENENVLREERLSYPIPGSHRLAQRWNAEREILKVAGARKALTALKKKSSYGFTVGSQHSWYATDMSTDSYREYSVPSTCRAVGNNCYIFVEDASWGTRVTQAAVDSIRVAFESRTPADATKGIYQLTTTYFGEPPNVDNDPKIVILILDIKDGYSGTGGYVAGYFYSLNEYLEEDVQLILGRDRHSNEAEIYYVDCNPASLTSSSGLYTVLGTTAHEFQHMIHWNYDEDEISFVNEGCSEVAEKLCGYGLRSPTKYYANTNVSFLSWDITEDVLADYSRAAIFTNYLVEQFGSMFVRHLVQHTTDGETGYNAALQAVGSQRQFKDVLKDFSVAAKLNNRMVKPQYGFDYPITSVPSDHNLYITPRVSSTTVTLQPYGTVYISYTSGTSLTIQFSATTALAVQAIAIGLSNIAVFDVPVGQSFSVEGFGNTYTTVTFAVTNLVETQSTFSYQSSGTGGASSMELKYDTTEPVGYLPLTLSDTVCVWFEGIQGMKLDSLRVALRRTGTVQGGIWRYTGVIQPRPLGTPLAVPIAATVTQTPSYPYPVPWPNWATIDVRSYNIDASTPFIVGFVVAGDPYIEPRVMVEDVPLPSKVTSLTYLSTSGNWYYLTSDKNTSDGQDSVYQYLIRAYVSNEISTVEPIELLPGKIQLSQNYPNPFNPGTTFHYVLPSDGYVTLKIYDMVGREVATVFEGESPKENTIYWMPTNLAAGVYLYRLETHQGIQARKLILIK